MSKLDIELNSEEVELLKKVHTATALKDMMNHPGYPIFSGIVKMMIERLENQHLNFAPNASRDAYWASGLRLAGARQFAMVLEDQIAKEIGILDQPLTTRRNGNLPEGDE